MKSLRYNTVSAFKGLIVKETITYMNLFSKVGCCHRAWKGQVKRGFITQALAE